MNQKDTRKETHEFNKLHKRLRRNVNNALTDFSMIEENDLVMACISGGKDSFVMLDILLNIQQTAAIKFDLVAVNLDHKQPDFPNQLLPSYFAGLGIPYYILDKDIHSVVKDKIAQGKTACGLCSRLRRGILYSFAEKIGATKIALGHHLDDMVETLFLNMFYGSRMKAMPPKLRSDDGRNIVIRPLTYCREKDLVKYCQRKAFPIISGNLCGTDASPQRLVIKHMLLEWDKKTPGRVENIFKSMQNIIPSQLADSELFDFSNLPLERQAKKAAHKFSDVLVSSTNMEL